MSVTAAQAEAKLRKMAKEAPTRADRAAGRAMLDFETRVRRNGERYGWTSSNGRGGTGQYLRSWSTRKVAGSDVRYSTGTNAPQGPRLEYGFFGTDSLGRVYAQHPYPHAGPAWKRLPEQLHHELTMGGLLS